MYQTYEELVEAVAEDYRDRRKNPFMTKKNGDKVPIPLWHDDYFRDSEDPCQLSEINLWTYWQGAGVRNPKAMIVGQDWGYIEGYNKTVENIKTIEKALKANKSPECLYQDNREYNEKRNFDTDKNLADVFRQFDRDLDGVRYPDLFFTNLCLGYRQGGSSTNDFSASWLTEDAEKYFKELVRLIQPEIIIALGQSTAQKAYKALTGRRLSALDSFMEFLDNQTMDGAPLPDGRKFFAMSHLGWKGVQNRLAGGRSVQQDWSILESYLKI